MYQFAVIGCGAVARKHAEQIGRTGRLAAVCDIVPEKADAFAVEYGARPWYSIDELLEGEKEIDVVVVCTPNGCHAEHCIKALQARRHVLCESPLCLTGAAAWQMIETEKYCGRRLFVVHAAAGNPALADVKQLVKENGGEQLFHFDLDCIGQPPALGEWRATAFPGGGALHAHFAGEMDMVSYLFGAIEEAVADASAVGIRGAGSEVGERGSVNVRMKNGVKGRIQWWLQEDGKKKSRLELSSFEQPVWAEDTGKFTGDADSYYEVYRQFVGEIEKNTGPSDSLFAGTRTVEAIEKIYQALSSNTPSST